MENEIWKQSPTLPNYEVSSIGRVRCIPHQANCLVNRTRTYGGKEWFGVWSKKDRRFILVHKGRTYKVARLVCEAFHGPAPDEKPKCLHRDENSRNNRQENLMWGTQRQNMNAPRFVSTKRFASQKLTPDDVRAIRRRGETERPADLAREFNVAACTISNIVARRMRKHVT